MASYPPPGRFADDPEVLRSDAPEVHKPFNTSETTPTYSAPNYTEKAPQPVHQERTICGLRRTTFFLALALATVIVLAAAIGGGVGSSVCHSNSNKSIAANSPPPSTATVTVTATINPTASSSTSTSAPSSTPSTYSTSPCPAQNNTVYSSQFKTGTNGSPGTNAALDFIIYCNTNFASGLGPHLAQVFAYTMTDCIEACASYNFWNDAATCEQVAWKVDGGRPGNCWIGTRNASEALTFESSALEIAFLQ